MQLQSNSQVNHSHKIADELAHFLADSYSLYIKTQNYHWNVTGAHFASYHLLFEGQYQDLANAVDLIAERIRALGCHAPASFTEFQKLSSLKEASGKPSAEDMIKNLLHDHETIAHHAHLIFAKAEKAGDQATMDLLTQRIQAHDKAAWMLRSTLG